jgi:type III pantothenate kinase
VIATGGLSSLIGPATSMIDVVDPLLTIQGLRLIWEMNRPACD